MQDPDIPTFKAYALQHIPAKDAEEDLRALLGLGFGVQNVSAGAGSSGGREERDDRRGGWPWSRGGDNNDSRNPFSRSNDNNNSSASATSDLAAKTHMTVNARTNQLLVAATEATHAVIAEALKTIDVEADDKFFDASNSEPYLEVYRLTDADAQEVTKSLSVLMPGVVVNEDGRNRLIHVLATAEQHRQVAQWIRQLDGLGSGMMVAVIPLAAKDPVTAAAELNKMFIGESNAPIIEPNLAGRQLMVRGNSDQLDQIKLLLAGMGEDGTGQRLGGSDSRIRRVSLSGRNAERLLDLIQQAWSSTQENHIQIIHPQERTSIYDLRLPDAWTRPESTDQPETPETTEAPGDARTSLNARPVDRTQARFVAFVEDEAPSGNAAESETGSSVQNERTPDQSQPEESSPGEIPLDPEAAVPAEDEEPADIYIRVEGDNLIISGDDPEALNALENLLQDAMAYVQPENIWKIYPLKSADAVETASMLELLIDDTTVSQKTTSSSDLSGMLRGFGNNVLGATGLDSSLASPGTLQIIPEPNLNALFVTGPTAKINELEQFLQILDASDWPESYRDRVPRLIPVKYAEVSRVYDIVSDVFSDYLQTGQNNLVRGGGRGDRGNNNGGGNPFAAMFLGGGGQQGGPEQTKLTLGIDEQTSHLIVSADNGLYLQIKGLVEDLDAQALAARRTVQVVTLQNTNSSVLQNTLQSLMPRVQVTTSGTRPGTSESRSSGGGDNNNGGGGPDQDQIRRMFEQRMRDRMQQQQQQQQQGGDSNGGGRPSFGGFGGFRGFGGDRGGRSGSDGGRPSFGGFSGFRGFGGDRGGRGGDRGR
jgi:Bacterial type II/III secretion system short domain